MRAYNTNKVTRYRAPRRKARSEADIAARREVEAEKTKKACHLNDRIEIVKNAANKKRLEAKKGQTVCEHGNSQPLLCKFCNNKE